ncbi:hypothetical protein [Stygiolobus sp. RP850M]
MKTSKIKNFSLIPTSWYYLPKIPITAVERLIKIKGVKAVISAFALPL